MQNIFLGPHANGVAGVGAALAAHHNIRLLGEHVNDLTLTFVAPLGTHENCISQKTKPRTSGANWLDLPSENGRRPPDCQSNPFPPRPPLAMLHACRYRPITTCTHLCRHAKGEPTEYAARAFEAGVPEIGFSDHSPMREDDFDEWRMRASELTQYAAKVEQARLDHPALPIRFRLEVDYLAGQEPWIREMADLHDWDYFIGSVHYVGDSAIDDPATLNQWRDRDTMEVWSAYFKT